MIRLVNQARLAAKEDPDAGVTLVEQIIVIIVFTVVMAIVTSAVVAMLRQERKQSAEGDNLNTNRKIEESLDYSARYANAVTVPGLGTDPNSDYYVEWQTGNTGETQTCDQWRYVPTSHIIQTRSWTISSPTSPTVISSTPWSTLTIGVEQTGATPIFAPGPYNAVDTSQSTTGGQQYQGSQQLTVTWTAIHALSQTLPAAITITAINSPVLPAPATTTCNQEGRS